jgi:hypothetical protein
MACRLPNGADWLAFLDTVRTKRFKHLLALAACSDAFLAAAQLSHPLTK